jgi:hypothetical protein
MNKPVTPRAGAVSDKAPRKPARKSIAEKNLVGASKIADEKLAPEKVAQEKVVKKSAAAPRKRAAAAKHPAASAIGPAERHHLIEVAAYYVAERRGFHGASSHADWLQAESEIDAMIAARKFAI